MNHESPVQRINMNNKNKKPMKQKKNIKLMVNFANEIHCNCLEFGIKNIKLKSGYFRNFSTILNIFILSMIQS